MRPEKEAGQTVLGLSHAEGCRPFVRNNEKPLKGFKKRLGVRQFITESPNRKQMAHLE